MWWVRRWVRRWLISPETGGQSKGKSASRRLPVTVTYNNNLGIKYQRDCKVSFICWLMPPHHHYGHKQAFISNGGKFWKISTAKVFLRGVAVQMFNLQLLLLPRSLLLPKTGVTSVWGIYGEHYLLYSFHSWEESEETGKDSSTFPGRSVDQSRKGLEQQGLFLRATAYRCSFL